MPRKVPRSSINKAGLLLKNAMRGGKMATAGKLAAGAATGLGGVAGVAVAIPMLLDTLDELGIELTGGKEKERRQLSDDIAYGARQKSFDRLDEMNEDILLPFALRQNDANQESARMFQAPNMERLDQNVSLTADTLLRGREMEVAQNAVPVDRTPSLLQLAAEMGAI